MNIDSVYRCIRYIFRISIQIFLTTISFDKSEKPELNYLKQGHVSVGDQDHDGSLTKTL
jgi:hypothetical protein